MMNAASAVVITPHVKTVLVFPTDQTQKITAVSVMMIHPMTVLRTVPVYGVVMPMQMIAESVTMILPMITLMILAVAVLSRDPLVVIIPVVLL